MGVRARCVAASALYTHRHACTRTRAGLADPGPVASALWTDEELEAGVQLDSIITVVDGLNIDRRVGLGDRG